MTSRIGYWKFLSHQIANDLDCTTASRGKEIESGFTEIIDAFETLMECTGSSENWSGCTETALKNIERIIGNG